MRPCGELQTSRPAGWRDTNNTQPHPGPIIDAIEEKGMIPGGKNRQRKASNKHYDPVSGKGTFEEEMIPD